MRTEANAKTPLFQAHGEDDMTVNYNFGYLSHMFLKKLGINTEFHKYEGMGHEAQPDELNDLGEWLKKILNTQEGAAPVELDKKDMQDASKKDKEQV